MGRLWAVGSQDGIGFIGEHSSGVLNVFDMLDVHRISHEVEMEVGCVADYINRTADIIACGVHAFFYMVCPPWEKQAQ